MSFFAPITNSLVAEQATAAFRLFATRAHGHPTAEAGGDEALKKDNDDGRRQKPVPPPRRRVRTNQPVVNRCLVEARRLAGGERVQGCAVGRRFKRSHSLRDRRQVEQRRLCSREVYGRTHLLPSSGHPGDVRAADVQPRSQASRDQLPQARKQCISDHRAALTPARPRRIWLAC